MLKMKKPDFRQEPIFNAKARDGWRGAFKRLGQLLPELN